MSEHKFKIGLPWVNKLLSNKKVIFSLVLLTLLLLIVFIGLRFMPYSYTQQSHGQENLSPSLQHFFGTDPLGRDLFVRVLYGVKISIKIALVASLINLVIGVAYGTIAGYIGGNIDALMMRMIDVLSSIPETIYIILIMIYLKSNFLNSNNIFNFVGSGSYMTGIYLTLGIIFWIPFARILRYYVLSLKYQDYILSAKASGASHLRIIFKYLLPNCIPLILSTVILRIPTAIFFEAFLSFIGLGVEPPMPSLGMLVSNSLGAIRSYPYLLLFPSLMLILIIFIFNLLGDGLRDVFDNREIS